MSLGYFSLDASGDGGMRSEYGFGGKQISYISDDTCIIDRTLYENEVRSRLGYGKLLPRMGELGIEIGILYGVGVRVDFYEFTDFFLGFGKVDLMKDDQIIEKRE